MPVNAGDKHGQAGNGNVMLRLPQGGSVTNGAIIYSFTNYYYLQIIKLSLLLNAFMCMEISNFLITFHFPLYLVNVSLMRQG